MGIFRWTYRIVKAMVVIYALFNAFLRSRWFTVGFMLWRVLRRKPAVNARKAAVIQFVNAGEPAIYRRRGLRKILSTRRSRV
jgi:hypothetical protein